jgi:hypothetical protein
LNAIGALLILSALSATVAAVGTIVILFKGRLPWRLAVAATATFVGILTTFLAFTIQIVTFFNSQYGAIATGEFSLHAEGWQLSTALGLSLASFALLGAAAFTLLTLCTEKSDDDESPVVPLS